jgi:hypothetical protein
LPGNGSVNTFPWKRDAHNTMETGVCSVGSVPRLYSKDPRPTEFSLVNWSEVK